MVSSIRFEKVSLCSRAQGCETEAEAGRSNTPRANGNPFEKPLILVFWYSAE